MDSLNGNGSCRDVAEPHHVESTKDKVTLTCSAASGNECKNIGTIKRSSEKRSKQNSECLDGDHAQWLLAAVRRVRDQKQRPNVNRIMNTLRIICPGRFHSRELVTEELEHAVSEGILLRVGGTGDNDNCSYRDPGRVVRLKSHSLHVNCDLDMTKFVVRSVRELANPAGSTAADVHRYIQSGYRVQIHDDSDLLSLIVKFCCKAVELGKLVCDEDSDECRYHPVYAEPKSNKINCTRTVSSSLASYLLVDRAFKTDVSEFYFDCLYSVVVMHICILYY